MEGRIIEKRPNIHYLNITDDLLIYLSNEDRKWDRNIQNFAFILSLQNIGLYNKPLISKK